jgi:hypothetical protein
MKCQWRTDCANQGTNNVYRALAEEESQSLAHGDGIIWCIPVYHHKAVCDDCLDIARQTYSVAQAEIDADSRL